MQTLTTAHASTDALNPPGALIGAPRCLQLTNLGRTAWLDRVRRKEAPQPIKIGRRTMWVEAEVLAYVADCVRRHREGAAK
jgi:predicted DNA-binding transcriptional regulator AlpA